MGDLFWNKIFGAILGTFLVVFALNEVSHILYHPHELEEPAYVIEVAELGAGPVEPEGPFDLGAALMAASSSNGARQARKCAACHTFEQGGSTLQGPNLWDVVGRQTANVEGFGYSGSLREFGGSWDYDRLWGFLENPRAYMNGTAMSFAGLRKEDDRADLIAYLQTLSASPVTFPAPLAAAAPVEEAGAARMDDEIARAEALADMIENASEPALEATDELMDAAGEAVDAASDMAADVEDNTADAMNDVAEDVVDAVTPVSEPSDAEPSDD